MILCFCATFQGLYIKAQYTLSNRLVTSTVLVFSPSCNFSSNLNKITLLNYQCRLKFVWAPAGPAILPGNWVLFFRRRDPFAAGVNIQAFGGGLLGLGQIDPLGKKSIRWVRTESF